MTTLYTWAARWGVPLEAVRDLQRQMGALSTDPAPGDGGASEGAVQTALRLEASAKGARLFRNNVGVLFDETGRPVRYGLANDSKQLNTHVKSADLIGIRPVVITPAMVGSTVGQFLSREIKPAAWRYSGTPREEAQLKWAELILSLGGDAAFATGPGTI